MWTDNFDIPNTLMYDRSRIVLLSDVYTVGTNLTTKPTALEASSPFVHGVRLHGPKGEIVRMKGVFDDGALINAIDSKLFEKVSKRLSKIEPSDKLLRMANRALVESKGVWRGTVEVGGVKRIGAFEIFPSGDSWALLFGKPLLVEFGAIHKYKGDTIVIPTAKSHVTITNEFGKTTDALTATIAGVSLTADVKQRASPDENRQPLQKHTYRAVGTSQKHEDRITARSRRKERTDNEENEEGTVKKESTGESSKRRHRRKKQRTTERETRTNAKGDESSPWREVPPHIKVDSVDQHIDEHTPAQQPPQTIVEETTNTETLNVYEVEPETTTTKVAIGAEQLETVTDLDASLFTRKTEPRKPERIAKIIELIEIGDDVSPEERKTIQDLIAEFADCFALSVGEVLPVNNAVHKLDIKPGTQFSTQIGQRRITPPQREYLNKVLDSLLLADVIAPIPAEEVKCCSAITLAQKAHGKAGMTLTEIQYSLNDQCVEAGYPPHFDLPLREPQPTEEAEAKVEKPKWRFCMNYAELN